MIICIDNNDIIIIFVNNKINKYMSNININNNKNIKIKSINNNKLFLFFPPVNTIK